ncbi:hypothetical protein Bbelb_364730 [Branchiostoma belcheri]|nr:hypothetical protein Bbelb_364730 [Branchiostoma belcheri]
MDGRPLLVLLISEETINCTRDMLSFRPHRANRSNPISYKTLAFQKDCYRYSYFPRTVRYWNELPQALPEIPEANKFEETVLLHDVPLPEEQHTARASKPQDGVSFRPIPYPAWPDHMKELNNKHLFGLTTFPEHLVPSIWDASTTCNHGNPWDRRDPVKEGWVAFRGVTIHLEAGALPNYIDRTAQETREWVVYFRPTTGNCDCRLPYDGQEDLLFNFSNKVMYSYSYLFAYLHNMMESQHP